jgi:hypothetical protein
MADAESDVLCTISPNSLISISDQCTRLENTDQTSSARGALVGSFVRDREGKITQMKVLDCIEILPKSEHVGDPAEMLATMIELCQANYPHRELLGYYEASPTIETDKPKGYDFPISAKRPVTGDANVKSSAHPQLFLLWNSSAKAAEKGMAIRLYKLQKNCKIGRAQDFKIDQEREAEMIALTDVLNLECNRTSLTKLQRYREGINALQQKGKMLLDYLSEVEEGKKQPDPTILRSMNSLLSRLPLTGASGEFQEELLTNYAGSQLYAYLGAMTENSVMLAHNSLATSASQRKYGSSYGFNMHPNRRREDRFNW